MELANNSCFMNFISGFVKISGLQLLHTSYFPSESYTRTFRILDSVPHCLRMRRHVQGEFADFLQLNPSG
jgi:hypothetical protein